MKIFIIGHCAMAINRYSKVLSQDLINMNNNIQINPTYTKVEFDSYKKVKDINHYSNINIKQLKKINSKIKKTR